MSLEEEMKRNQYNGFSAFYDAYGPALYGILYRSTADQQLAAQLLQQVFLELQASVSQADPYGCSVFIRAIRLCRSKADPMAVVK